MYTFDFTTRTHRDIRPNDLPPLNREILQIYNVSEIATFIDKEKVIDIYCELIIAEIEIQKTQQQLFIINIQLPYVDGAPLVQKRLINVPGHQLDLFAA